MSVTTCVSPSATKAPARRADVHGQRVVLGCVCLCVVWMVISHGATSSPGRFSGQPLNSTVVSAKAQDQLPEKEHENLQKEATTLAKQEALLVQQQKALDAQQLDRADRIHWDLKQVLRQEREESWHVHEAIGKIRKKLTQSSGIVNDTVAAAHQQEASVLAKLELQQSQLDKKHSAFMAQRDEVNELLQRREEETGLSVIKEEERYANRVHQMVDVERQQVKRREKIRRHLREVMKEEKDAYARGNASGAQRLAGQRTDLEKHDEHAAKEARTASRQAHEAQKSWVKMQSLPQRVPDDAARAKMAHERAVEIMKDDMSRVDEMDSELFDMDVQLQAWQRIGKAQPKQQGVDKEQSEERK